MIVCAFTEARWEALGRAVASALRQRHPPLETIVVVDHHPGLLERAARELTGARVLANTHGRGLSGARNSGLEAARGDVLAFLDDDAVAEEDWLGAIAAAMEDPSVHAAGGAVVPEWTAGRPAWFPAEFDWVVGCAHSGMPERRADVRNLIGANMAFRATALRELGGFREGLGRVGSTPLGCEETELCIQLRRRRPAARIVYDPAASVRHLVPPERATHRYFLARCRAEGRSKALVARLVGSGPALSAERTYTRHTLPRGVLRGLRDALRGDLHGLARAGAILTGLAATALGYLYERLTGEIAG